MTYAGLPAVGTLPLPEIKFIPTAAENPGRPGPVELVFVHRWGVNDWHHEHMDGVLNGFKNPANKASSHLIYAGEHPAVASDAGRCVQMVKFADTAWTEMGDNVRGVAIETGDQIWEGADPEGFARLARIVAFLTQQRFKLPVHWQRDPNTHGNCGIARHADGGAFAGGHTDCPTTDIELWQQFIARVQQEAAHGKFRPSWGE